MHLKLAAALACPLAALILAACGSGKGSATASTAGAAADAFKFSRCMREHGVTGFPDPNVGPGGGMMLRFDGAAKVSPQTMESAQRACRRFAPGDRQTLTPQQRVQREEAALKFARCMRAHGVDVPNPTTSGGGIQFHRGPGGGPNPESPAFQSAQKDCQSLLPLKGGAEASTSKSAGGGIGLQLAGGG